MINSFPRLYFSDGYITYAFDYGPGETYTFMVSTEATSDVRDTSRRAVVAFLRHLVDEFSDILPNEGEIQVSLKEVSQGATDTFC